MVGPASVFIGALMLQDGGCSRQSSCRAGQAHRCRATDHKLSCRTQLSGEHIVQASSRAARIDLATAFRWGAKLGMNEGVNGGHLSYSPPGHDDSFLAIPNGVHWA